jgi:prevent-host-death family protein
VITSRNDARQPNRGLVAGRPSEPRPADRLSVSAMTFPARSSRANAKSSPGRPRRCAPLSGNLWLRATLCHTMDVSVRELRNHTARVIAAIEGGEPVVLTVHGRPVADIVPRARRSERRPSELLLGDLEAIVRLAGELGIESDESDFDVGLTTDDMAA